MPVIFKIVYILPEGVKVCAACFNVYPLLTADQPHASAWGYSMPTTAQS